MVLRQQPHNSGASLPSLSVALLSDDVNLCALLQHMLALSEAPSFSTQTITANQFSASLALQSDVIFIDRHYRAQIFSATLNELSEYSNAALLPTVVLLLDENSLAADLGQLANAARLGVDTFLLKPELSLNKILAIINQSDGVEAPYYEQAKAPALLKTATAEQLTSTESFATNSSHLAHQQQALPHSAPVESSYQQVHQLTVDIQNQRVHISAIADSDIFNEEETMLDMAQWIAMLDLSGASEFESMIEHASNYQPIPKQIHCRLPSQHGEQLPAIMSEIQIKNDGQGRVVGASAQLAINHSSELHSNLAARPGFDNLGDTTELISNDQTWEKVSHSLPMICLLLDEHGQIAKVINNDAIAQPFFPEVEQGQILADLLEIETLDNLAETINRTLNTGKAHQQTITYPGPNGMRWLDTHITKLKGDAGLSRQVVWSAIDITSTRHAYQELLKSHDTLADLIDQAPVLFFQKDGSGRYTNANKAFCELFDVRSDIIAGRNNKEVFNGNTLTHMQQIENSLDDENPSIYTQYDDTINDAQYQFHWKTTLLKSAANTVVESIIGFGFAIKQQPQSTPTDNTVTALPTANSDLAEVEFSGAIAQDFKTILSGIVNYTEMAMSQKNAGREGRFIDYIDQVIHTSNHARTLLAECSVHDGSEDNIQATELKSLITDVVETLRPTLPSQLDFRVELDANSGQALVCAKAFRKIVMQLLISARDNAKNTNNKNLKQEILLTLSNTKLSDTNCDACKESLAGDFIALTVHSKVGVMSDKNHRALIKAAQSATQRQTSDNVVAMTHGSAGHAIIQYHDETLSLKMLFPKA